MNNVKNIRVSRTPVNLTQELSLETGDVWGVVNDSNGWKVEIAELDDGETLDENASWAPIYPISSRQENMRSFVQDGGKSVYIRSSDDTIHPELEVANVVLFKGQ